MVVGVGDGDVAVVIGGERRRRLWTFMVMFIVRNGVEDIEREEERDIDLGRGREVRGESGAAEEATSVGDMLSDGEGVVGVGVVVLVLVLGVVAV